MGTAAPDLEGRLFITVTELAALLQLDPRTVRRGIEDGSIPAVRVGRSTRIPVPKIRALIGLDPPGKQPMTIDCPEGVASDDGPAC